MQKIVNDRWLLFPVLVTAVLIAVGAVLIIALSGDAASTAGSASSPPQTDAGGAVMIDIADFKFMPENVTVQAGSKVTWINRDTAPHTATSSDAFDTGTLKKNDKKTLTLKKAGTYAYICEFHAFMKATVIVQ